MQLRTVLDVKVVDVEKRRHPSKHYVMTKDVVTILALRVPGSSKCCYVLVLLA
ncbi:hypothetical protein C0J45_20162 [Silurus meridionalis]|nr:hypothetical protein C0J45_20162 [Silurus meridionalis]